MFARKRAPAESLRGRRLNCQGAALDLHDPAYAAGGQIQHGVQFLPAKGMALRGALNLDKGTGVVHDDVHIGLGIGVFRVVQVQNGDGVEDARGHGRDHAMGFL